MQSTKAPIQCHVLCVERVVLELQALHLLPCFHQLCLRALPRLNGADPIACTSISELQSAKSLCLACCLGQHLHRIRKPWSAPSRASFAWCSRCRFHCGTCTCRLVRRFVGGKRKRKGGAAVYAQAAQKETEVSQRELLTLLWLHRWSQQLTATHLYLITEIAIF